MYKAVGTHLVVKIDRELQRDASLLSGTGLVAAPLFEYMQYHLQWGDILSVGPDVSDPAVRVGRRAILHHMVEEEDRHLIETLDNGDQIRWVNTFTHTFSYRYFGIITEKGVIMPAPQFIFCTPEVKPEDLQEYESEEFAGEKLQFITKRVGSIYVAQVPVKEEEKKYFKCQISHLPRKEEHLEVGQVIIAQDFTRYPITLFGTEYWILSRENVISTFEDD